MSGSNSKNMQLEFLSIIYLLQAKIWDILNLYCNLKFLENV